MSNFYQITPLTKLPLSKTQSFTYSSEADLDFGQVIEINFANRAILGVVLNKLSQTESQNIDIKKIKDIIKAIKPIKLSQQQISLANFMADYYYTSIGLVLKSMVPPVMKRLLKSPPDKGGWGVLPVNKINPTTTQQLETIKKGYIYYDKTLTEKAKQNRKTPTKSESMVWRKILRDKQFQEYKFIRQKPIDNFIVDFYCAELMLVIEIDGFTHGEKVEYDINRAEILKKYGLEIVRYYDEQVLNNIEGVYVDLQLKIQAQKEKKQNLINQQNPPTPLIRGAELKAPLIRGVGGVLSEKENNTITPTSEQSQIIQDIENSNQHNHLIHGVTGSGKTEIYLQIIKKAIEQDKQSIVMVPEISLTPQAIERYSERFGADKIALVHSNLTNSEKFLTWQRIKNNEVKIIIGPRSAIFAPVVDLAYIIIDEEHDSSYKQYDQNPRYHARVVAEKLAGIFNAKLILGSATPSLDSYYKTIFNITPLTRGAGGLAEMASNINQKITDYKFLPYNEELTEKAKQNRKTPTKSELKIWQEILRDKQFQKYKFTRQRPVDNFIIDFYCAELMIAIEVDGFTHGEKEEYDKKRTEILENYGIQVIRYTDEQVLSSIEGVYIDLENKIKNRINELENNTNHVNPPNPPCQGGIRADINKQINLQANADLQHTNPIDQQFNLSSQRSNSFRQQNNLSNQQSNSSEQKGVFSNQQTNYPEQNKLSALAPLTRGVGGLVEIMNSTNKTTPHTEEHTQLHQLTKRITGDQMPKVEIVDMRNEFNAKNFSVFSLLLQEKIKEYLDKKQQIVLYLNRRGAATFVSCRNCGYVEKCDRCDIPLTYHYNQNNLICHHCNFQKTVANHCPTCQSLAFKFFGSGTQKVESELTKLFAGVKILRMDKDTTGSKDAHHNFYQQFKNHEYDILIGTQMITKGWDLSNVGLVGIIAADMTLNLPDFRSSERAFQLITQVAGRTGRGKDVGEVILQTYSPENFIIQTASKHDFTTFYQQEIKHREELSYPPFSRLIKLFLRHPDKIKAEKAAEELANKLLANNYPETDLEIIGPSPAFIPRVNNNFLWQIIIKIKNNNLNIKNLLKDVPNNWIIDIDPESLL